MRIIAPFVENHLTKDTEYKRKGVAANLKGDYITDKS